MHKLNAVLIEINPSKSQNEISNNKSIKLACVSLI